MMKKIHGHTKIELTNVNTGEIVTIEDHNTFTNAIEYLFNAPFDLPNKFLSPKTMWEELSEDSLTNVQNYTQGLFLFENPLGGDSPQEEELKKIINPPSGNNVTGIGDDQVYSGVISEYGSYNSVESYISDKNIQYVWDFNTSQANGKISAACLTPLVSANNGYDIGVCDTSKMSTNYGYPNKIGSSNLEDISNNSVLPPYTAFGLPHGEQVTTAGMKESEVKNTRNRFPYFNLEKGFGLLNQDTLYFNNSGYNCAKYYSGSSWAANQVDTGFFVNKDSFTLSKFNLNSSLFNFSDSVDNYDIINNLEDIIITIPTELSTILKNSYTNIITNFTNKNYSPMYIGDIQASEKYLYVVFVPFYEQNNGLTASNTLLTGTIQPNQSFYILRIDIENNFSTDFLTITNSLEENLLFTVGSSHTNSAMNYPILAPSFYVTDTHILCKADSGYMNINYTDIDNLTWAPIINKIDKSNCTTFIEEVSATNYCCPILDSERNIIFSCNIIYKGSFSSNTYYVTMIDLEKSTCSYINSRLGWGCLNPGTSAIETSSYNMCPLFGHNLFKYCLVYQKNDTSKSYLPRLMGFSYYNPLLITINNITPVEKTNEQTMKVTYKLTWD